MGTTLTREKMQGWKPRYEEVELPDGEIVGLRDRTVLKESQRASRMVDELGNVEEGKFNLRDVYTVIDQVMIDESTPLYSEDDAEWLATLGSAQMQNLLSAIRKFNEGTSKKKDASEHSSES